MKQIVVTLVPGHALGETIVAKGLTLHMEGDKKFVWADEIASVSDSVPVAEPEPVTVTVPEPEKPKKAKKPRWDE